MEIRDDKNMENESFPDSDDAQAVKLLNEVFRKYKLKMAAFEKILKLPDRDEFFFLKLHACEDSSKAENEMLEFLLKIRGNNKEGEVENDDGWKKVLEHIKQREKKPTGNRDRAIGIFCKSYP